MAKKILTTPIQKSDLEGIKPGDVIYLTGHITTTRDMGHRRVVEEGQTLPVDVKDGAILHAGPIIRTISDNEFEVVSVGPTKLPSRKLILPTTPLIGARMIE